jgi:hypothetical protein
VIIATLLLLTYFDHVHSSIILSYLLSSHFKAMCNGFHYAISIHVYEILRSYSPPSLTLFTGSFHPPTWFPCLNNSLLHSCHFKMFRLHIMEKYLRIYHYKFYLGRKEFIYILLNAIYPFKKLINFQVKKS